MVLLGSDSQVEARVKQTHAKIVSARSVAIPNSSGVEGFAQYAVIVGPGAKLIDIQALSPDDALAGLKSSVLYASVPQSFPDDTTLKLPRAGALACPRAEQPCSFTFTSAVAASRVVSEG